MSVDWTFHLECQRKNLTYDVVFYLLFWGDSDKRCRISHPMPSNLRLLYVDCKSQAKAISRLVIIIGKLAQRSIWLGSNTIKYRYQDNTEIFLIARINQIIYNYFIYINFHLIIMRSDYASARCTAQYFIYLQCF